MKTEVRKLIMTMKYKYIPVFIGIGLLFSFNSCASYKMDRAYENASIRGKKEYRNFKSTFKHFLHLYKFSCYKKDQKRFIIVMDLKKIPSVPDDYMVKATRLLKEFTPNIVELNDKPNYYFYMGKTLTVLNISPEDLDDFKGIRLKRNYTFSYPYEITKERQESIKVMNEESQTDYYIIIDNKTFKHIAQSFGTFPYWGWEDEEVEFWEYSRERYYKNLERRKSGTLFEKMDKSNNPVSSETE